MRHLDVVEALERIDTLLIARPGGRLDLATDGYDACCHASTHMAHGNAHQLLNTKRCLAWLTEHKSCGIDCKSGIVSPLCRI